MKDFRQMKQRGEKITALTAYDYPTARLLDQLIGIERTLGRQRGHAKNFSRTIDIDMLYCGDRNLENERLQLPHPRMHLRKFVLQPLADIRPDLVLPGQTQTVDELLAKLKESGEVARFMDNW